MEGENKNEGILRSDRRYRRFEIGKRKDSGMVNLPTCIPRALRREMKAETYLGISHTAMIGLIDM